MDPLTILGLTASIVQLAQVTAHTSKLLKTTCDRIKNAPESARETHQYVQRLEVILRVIAESRGSDATASEESDAVVVRDGLVATAAEAPEPMDEYLRPLLAQAKDDLKELDKEIEGLVAVFADDSVPAAGGKGSASHTSAPRGTLTSTTTIATGATPVHTPAAITLNGRAVTKKLKQGFGRSKGRVKAFFKDDKIQELKRKIEGHVSVFTLVFSAEARSHSRRSAQGTDHIKALLATHQQRAQQLELRQQLQQQQLLITQAFAYKMLENGTLDSEMLMEYRKLNLEPPPPSKSSSPRTIALPSWTKPPENTRQTQTQDLRVAEIQKTYRRLGWKWSVHQLGIGQVSMATSEHHVTTDYGLEEEYGIPNDEEMWRTIDLMVSVPSISPRVLKASLRSGGTWFSGFTYTISMPMYNSNPDLLDAVRRCDVHKMRVLFAKRQAHPTDLLAPWGKSLLHEAVLSYAAGRKDAMKMCELLLSMLQGNINVRSMDGRTPLLLCCKTSAGHTKLLRRMEPLTRLLLANGADMSLQDANGQSSAQLLFTAGGVSSLKTAFLQRVGIVEFQNMNQLDSWMFTSIARIDSTFKATLEQQIKELRTDPSISGDRRTYPTSTVLDMSVTKLVKELKEAEPKVRSVFMRAVCAHGTAEMLEPLLRRGLDPNEEFESEVDNNISYLGEAAMNGNLPNIEVLLAYGADINAGTRYRPLDAILERWAVAGDRDLALREQPILERLLAVPGCWSADAIIRGIYSFNAAVIERLLQAEFGRNDSHPCVSLYQLSGSEANEAIKHRYLPALKLLVKYKKNLDYPDCEGYTALLHALDKGYPDFVEVLLEGDADVRGKTKCGISAWDLVNMNRRARHPRRPAFEGTMGYTDKYESVDQETDQKMYEMVRNRMMQTGGLEAEDNNGWILHTANKMTSVVHRDVRADFDRFRVWLDKNPPSELLFMASTLALALCMFVVMQAYETLWWVFRARKAPRAKDMRTFVIAGAGLVYWWMTSRRVRVLDVELNV